jgi:cellulose synthase/poly-beta-1,6-N-acetylglucosamine synthase-like glycosyltransferase
MGIVLIELVAAISLIASVFIQSLHIFYVSGYGLYRPYGFSSNSSRIGGYDVEYVTIAIPIKNEDPEVLRGTLDVCTKINWDAKRFEIIVVSDDPPDRRTKIQEIADHYISMGYSVRIIYRDNPQDGRVGALNLAVREAMGDIILFLDVDTRPSSGVIRRAVELINMGCDAVVFRWRGYYYYETRLAKALSTAMEFIVSALYRGRSGYGFHIVPLGSGTVYRKSLIEEIGLWDNNIVQDDYWMGIKLSRLGANICYCDDEHVDVMTTSTYRAFKIQQTRWSFGAIQAIRRGMGIIIRSKIHAIKKLELVIYGLQYTPTIMIAISSYLYPLLLPLHSGGDPLLSIIGIFIAWIIVSATYIVVYAIITSRRQGISALEAIKRLGTSSAATASLALHIAINQVRALFRDRYSYMITPKGSRENSGASLGLSEAPEIAAIIAILIGIAISIIKGYELTLLWLMILIAPYMYTIGIILIDGKTSH